MPELDDIALLRQYAKDSSESGFATLVEHSGIHKWLEAPEHRSDANGTDWGWMQQRTLARAGQSP
ncbi:MAG: hypothetical protein ACLQU6_09845 [Limisphaerales bacterium]